MNSIQDRLFSFPWNETRAALINHFTEAQNLLQTNQREVDLYRPVPDFPEEASDHEILAETFRLWSIVSRKTGFHIASVLLANAQNNIHSLGVHAKVLMECAAEMMSMGKNAAEQTPEALDYILNNQEYDANYWLLRLSKGSISREELVAMVTEAREGIGLFDGKQPTRVSLSDRASILAEGKIWYPYLNDSFCHTKPDRLRGVPGLGGVLPSPKLQLDLAFVFVLNIALHYTCQALMSYGGIKINTGGGSKIFDDAFTLFERVRQTAAPFRELQNEFTNGG